MTRVLLAILLIAGCSPAPRSAAHPADLPHSLGRMTMDGFVAVPSPDVDGQRTRAPKPVSVATASPTSEAVATPSPSAVVPVRRTATIVDARAYARRRLGPTQFRCLDALVQRESRWRVNATNRRSGAYGLPQALPGSKMAAFGADWRTNPITQLRWMIAYIAGRYGTACRAWRYAITEGWY